ncbi:Scr1 family TA system antitoxin-like transcriptional regulator [Streptomyces sp. NPDC002851]
MARAENKTEVGVVSRIVSDVARMMREMQNLSQEQVGKKAGFTGAAVSAMETCAQPASDKMLENLEPVIGAGYGFFERAREYVRLEKYPAQFQSFAPLEQKALTISSYQTMAVDGLFQTEEYAHSQISGNFPPLKAERVDELVAARMERKSLFDREPVAWLELILDEAVLKRGIGSREIMRRQLHHLVECSERQNVVVQVLPLCQGFNGKNSGTPGPMKLVETLDNARLVYLEPQDESMLISTPAKVSAYAHRYAKIRAQALGTQESLGLIRRLAGELK